MKIDTSVKPHVIHNFPNVIILYAAWDNQEEVKKTQNYFFLTLINPNH